MKRFAFCYEMSQDSDRIRETVPAHVQYWKDADLEQYAGGPFADRSGGLITFAAAGLEEATAIARQDPFLRDSLLGNWWVKEWLV